MALGIIIDILTFFKANSINEVFLYCTLFWILGHYTSSIYYL